MDIGEEFRAEARALMEVLRSDRSDGATSEERSSSRKKFRRAQVSVHASYVKRDKLACDCADAPRDEVSD